MRPNKYDDWSLSLPASTPISQAVIALKFMGGPEEEISPRQIPNTDLPSARVTRRFDSKADRTRSVEAGGMDQVEIYFDDLTVCVEFLRTFWIAMGSKEVQWYDNSDFEGQISHRSMRSKIVSNNDSRVTALIYGNWEPLAEDAKSWLPEHTLLQGSLD